jgi:predicted transcriptional regulator of viral defense system
MSDKVTSVRAWIDDLPKRGRITFSMAEAEILFSSLSKKAIRSSIYRLINSGRLYSAWRGFYIIVPDEHALKGLVPPIEYIESLMAYIGHKYYVGLLSAAAIHGAGHQQPQVLTVVTDSDNIRSKSDKSIRFFTKSLIPELFIVYKRAGYGKVAISSPELTALDLVCYEKRIGGLNRAIEIISELDLDFSESGRNLLLMYRIPIVQRLGYIIENVLGLEECGAVFYSESLAAGIKFRKTLLDPGINSENDFVKEDCKWKVIVNCNLEVEL